MKGCQYIVVTEAGAAGIAKSTNKSTYVAVVATWTQKDTLIKTDDPEVQGKYGIGDKETTISTEFSMTTTTVNYQEMVDPYTMPFDLLWAFLVVGEEKEFVFDLADLVYGSDIQITVHDNLTINTDINDWNYTKVTKAVVDYDITAKYKSYKSSQSVKDDEHDPYGEEPYNTVKTIITKTNTLNIELTRANVWIVDYKNEFTYAKQEQPEQTNTNVQTDQDYPSEPDSTGSSFNCQEIENTKRILGSNVISAFQKSEGTTAQVPDPVTGEVITNPAPTLKDITYDISCYVEYYSKYVGISNTITNKVLSKRYTKGVPDLQEKTDKDSEEPNFVTIYKKAKHRETRKNISSAASWLFEIIETNDSTTDKLDLIKYLLYKATGKSYGVEEYDFSEFDASKFQKITAGSEGGLSLHTTMFTKEVFIQALQAYYNKTRKSSLLQQLFIKSSRVI